MKQVVRIILAAAAVSALMAGSAFAADKLVIKGTDGTTTVFSVTDAGVMNLPTSVVTGAGATFKNAANVANFASVAAVPDATLPNQGVSLQVIPRGTGFNATIKAQFSIFNTDLVADPINYEFLAIKSGGTFYSINAARSGTGATRPIYFQIGNQSKMALDTTGFVGIGTTTPTAILDVNNAVSTSGLRIRTSNTPASSTATCNQGDISWDASFVYVCVAANSWKRATLGTF